VQLTDEWAWRSWVFAAGAAVWGAVVLQRLWSWPGVRRRPWHIRLQLLDLVAVVVLFFVAEQLSRSLVTGLGIYDSAEGTETPRSVFLRMSLLHLLDVLLIPMVLVMGGRVQLYQLGIHCKRLGKVVAFGLLQLLAWWPIVVAINVAVRSNVVDRTPHPAEVLLQQAAMPVDWALLAFSVAVAAPLGEELLFRGILQAWLGRYLRPTLAIVVAAVAFGLMHSTTWPDPVPLTALGIGLGMAYHRTQSLWAPVALHATFNGIMLFVGYLTL
jgi:membrane protease YdiL (CAAX protease family)